MSDKLIVIQQNIRSLRANFDLFLTELVSLNFFPDIIIFTEIWIESVEINCFKIPNYNSFFRCNDTYRAGGVAIFVKNNIVNVEVKEVECNSADILFISFEVNKYKISLVATYRLQRFLANVFLNEINQLFSNVNSIFRKSKNLIWIGDININILSGLNTDYSDEYIALMSMNGLECLIKEPTRITQFSETCIDHVFVRVTDKNVISMNAIVVHAGITDHSMVQLDVRVVGGGRGRSESPSPPSTPHYRTDFKILNQLLDNTDWSAVYWQTNASSAFDSFFALFQNALLESKVVIKKKSTEEKKLKPWINDYICRKIKRRNHIFKLVKTHPENINLLNYYRRYRNKLQLDIKMLKDNYYRQQFENCKNDTNTTWKLIKTITGQNKDNNRDIKLEKDNRAITDSLAIANEFNTFFLDIVEQLNIKNNLPDNVLLSPLRNYFPTNLQVRSMFMSPILADEVLSVIQSLKTKSSPGIDNISSFVIKEMANKIVDILTYIINFSFESGTFPSQLKYAVVIPIFKNGSKLNCNNYRPISLLSSFSKIYEKLMKKRLLAFLELTNFFSKRQFGFRSGLNTEHALLHFMNDVNSGINSGQCVSGLFLDIKKAFDTVNHEILLEKLNNCGVRGCMNKWFRSYLFERKQCVKINSVTSDLGVIRSGVPQGSVLGALLFIIYINDLCSSRLHGTLTSFADDTALCYKKDNWESIKEDMSMDLKALQWWFTKNNMLLSAEKTKFLNFSLKNNDHANGFNEVKYTCAECLENNLTCPSQLCSIIEKTREIKYLGVFLDSEVNWKYHINKLRGKINAISRYFYFLRQLCNDHVMRILYFALVQSRLEYGIVLWGNTFQSYLYSLKTQQKMFMRIILNRNRFDHSQPLFKDLKILPLKSLFVFKILRMFYLRSGTEIHIVPSYRLKLRNYNHFRIPKPNNEFFKRTYDFVAPRIFNKLPDFLKSVKTVRMFSNKLKSWLLQLDNVDNLFLVHE